MLLLHAPATPSLHVLVHVHQRFQSLPAITIADASGPLGLHGTLGLHRSLQFSLKGLSHCMVHQLMYPSDLNRCCLVCPSDLNRCWLVYPSDQNRCLLPVCTPALLTAACCLVYRSDQNRCLFLVADRVSGLERWSLC